MGKFLRRLAYLLRQRQREADLAEEIEFHRALKEHELEANDLEPREARTRAKRALGSSALARDQARDVWVPILLQGIGQDFRLALRSLWGTPVLTGVAALSLTLGIGANTTIFALTEGLLLRPLPVKEPDRLVLVTTDVPRAHPYWDFRIWLEIHRHSQLFDGTLAWADTRFNLSSGGETRHVNGVWVSGSFFDVLGVTALRGRLLTETDDAPGGGPDGPVAIVSYDFWRRHFNGAEDVIGQPVTVERIVFTIVGVTPQGFFGAHVGHSFDIAAPLRAQALTRDAGGSRDPRDGPQVAIMARLRPGDPIDSASAALRGVQPQIREATLPQGWPQAFLDRYLTDAFTVEPAANGLSELRRRFTRPLLAIMIVVALVLLVACANLANLALARAAGRRHELGIRLALGASRWRLLRQLLAESVVLGSIGATAGLLMAWWSAPLLVRRLFTNVSYSGPRATTGTVFLDHSFDGPVLGFTAALTVFTVLLFGLFPALRASRIAPLDAIIERTTGSWRRRGTGPRDVLILLQVAISLVVVVAAGLFTRTLTALETRPLGFNRDGVLITTIEAHHTSVPPDRRAALYRNVVEAVGTLPGVSDAALSSKPPVTTGPILGQPISAVSGQPPLPPRGAFSSLNLISPGWFRTMGIPLLRGRDVSSNDRLETTPVVVVNDTFARTFFHGANPIGRTVTLFLPGPPPPPVEIVGVVADTVYGGLRDQVQPTMFLPIEQRDAVWWPFLASVNLALRSDTDRPEMLSKSVAAAIGAVNADLALTFHPLTAYVHDVLVQERLTRLLSVSMAVVALLLAALGLYGVTAYAIASRRAEIGIRLALGAAPKSVVRLVLTRVLWLTAAGVLVGAVMSFWASTFVAALLYGLEPRDPATMIIAITVLAATALLAGWLPARKAAQIDPVIALRFD